jgi:Na+/proline symporter
MPPSITGNSLGWLDYLVIALYLGVNVGIGWWVQRQKRTTNADYFLGGGRVPPWASAISWYGTAVSSVSFMALPAYAYSKDWLPMIVGPAGSGVGIIVAYCFLGIIRRLKAPTIFAYLEARFDRNVRLIVAGLSMVLKVFGRASVIMVLPALALASATGLSTHGCADPGPSTCFSHDPLSAYGDSPWLLTSPLP